jgi:hypothetical protein
MRAGRVLGTLFIAILVALALSTSAVLADSESESSTSTSGSATQQTTSSGGFQTMSVTWCRAC